MNCSSRNQKIENAGVELILCFHIRKVRGRNLQATSAGNVVSEKMCLGGRGNGVARSGENEGGDTHGVEGVAEVEIANCCAIGEVALWVGGFQHRQYRLRLDHVGIAKGWSKPTFDHAGCNVFHSSRFHGLNPCLPCFGGAEFCGGVTEKDLVDRKR